MEPVIPFSWLSPLFEGDSGGDGLAVAQNGDLDLVADFASAQGISEIVEILDGFVAKLNEDISGLEAGFGGGRTGLYIGKAHAIFGLAEVGDGAEVRAIAATAAAGRSRVRIGTFDHRNDPRTIRRVVQA